jgi:S-adenosyl methyltransferase
MVGARSALPTESAQTSTCPRRTIPHLMMSSIPAASPAGGKPGSVPSNRPSNRQDIRSLFTGFDLVEPGLVDVSQWRPDINEKPARIRFLAGVARKPGGSALVFPRSSIAAIPGHSQDNRAGRDNQHERSVPQPSG